jgi:hypothetical protein
MSKHDNENENTGNAAADPRAAFLAKFAAALWDIHKARRVRRDTGDTLSMFGITTGEVTGDETPEFTVAPINPETYIGAGMLLRDLSEAKQAEYVARELTRVRKQAYSWLKERTEDYGDYTAESVIRHFQALGFPLPKQTTEVRAYVRQGDGSSNVYVCCTLDGEVGEDTVKAALLPHASHSESYNLTMAAFPSANGGTASEDLVSEVRARVRTNWADISDIT